MPRPRSKPRFVRTPNSLGFSRTCGTRAVKNFRGPPSNFRVRKIVNSFVIRGHRDFNRWIGLTANTPFYSEWLRKRAMQRKHGRRVSSSGGVERWSHQPCTLSARRFGCGSGLRSAFPKSRHHTLLLGGSLLWCTWEHTSRGFALPTLKGY